MLYSVCKCLIVKNGFFESQISLVDKTDKNYYFGILINEHKGIPRYNAGVMHRMKTNRFLLLFYILTTTFLLHLKIFFWIHSNWV